MFWMGVLTGIAGTLVVLIGVAVFYLVTAKQGTFGG